MKKKNKKYVRYVYLLLIIMFLSVCFFCLFRRSNAVVTIDFSSCKEVCNYKLLLNNKIYKLKYEKIDNVNSYPDFIGKIYLNNVNILTTEEYGELKKVRIFKDLLLFEEHIGTSADGDTIKIYNKSGNLLKNIYILDEKTGMHVSNYYNDNTASYYIDTKGDNLIIYGTMKNDSGMININNVEYKQDYKTLSNLINIGTISTTDPYSASYKISYDEIINNKNLKLYETIETVGHILDESN